MQTEVSAAKVRNLQPTWGSVVSGHCYFSEILKVDFYASATAGQC